MTKTTKTKKPVNFKKVTKTARLQEVTKQENTESKQKFRLYLGYMERIIIIVVLFICNFAICLFLASKSLDKEQTEPIDFKEYQYVDYKVYLKENDFYKKDYLDKNMLYVASLIDKVCKDINVSVSVGNLTNISANQTNINGHELGKKSGEEIIVTVSYGTDY